MLFDAILTVYSLGTILASLKNVKIFVIIYIKIRKS